MLVEDLKQEAEELKNVAAAFEGIKNNLIDFKNLVVIGLLALALAVQAQGKKLRYEAEVEQFADLEGGWLLVPVDLGGGGIAASNAQAAAAHMMRTRRIGRWRRARQNKRP